MYEINKRRAYAKTKGVTERLLQLVKKRLIGPLIVAQLETIVLTFASANQFIDQVITSK